MGVEKEYNFPKLAFYFYNQYKRMIDKININYSLGYSTE